MRHSDPRHRGIHGLQLERQVDQHCRLLARRHPEQRRSAGRRVSHGQYALANLLYYPVEDVMAGREVQWGDRENFLDGFTSHDFAFSSRCGGTSVFQLEAIDARDEPTNSDWICQRFVAAAVVAVGLAAQRPSEIPAGDPGGASTLPTRNTGT